MLASSQCQRPNAEAGEAHKAYTLTSFGTRQGQAEATTGESCVDRPPPGRRYPLTLALQTLPALLPLHGLPGQAGTATCSDSARGPGWTVPGAWAGPSPSVCVYVRVMLPLLLPQPGGRIHTGIHAHDGLGTWSPELLPELDLMQTFLCLLGRGTSEGPGSKPVGLRATAEQGAAPGFRHTTTHGHVPMHVPCAPVTCIPPHMHLMLYTWRLLTSLTPGVSPHLPLTCCPSPTHPGTPNGSSLIPPCPQPRGALPDGVCEYATGVPGWTMASVRAVACPFLGLAGAPVRGLSCEACALTLF